MPKLKNTVIREAMMQDSTRALEIILGLDNHAQELHMVEALKMWIDKRQTWCKDNIYKQLEGMTNYEA